MSTTPNGRQNGYVSHPAHRFDDLAELASRRPLPPPPSASPTPPRAGGRDYSGRRFVLSAAVGVALLWGGLYALFYQWRAQYLVRASFGATRVAPAIDGMGTIAPPGVPRDDWEDAVRRTHALVVTLTDSNLLSIPQMEDLRAELLRSVDRALAKPETALAELAAVWDSLADRAAFVLRDTRAADGRRHIRPAILPTTKTPQASPPPR
jgi:hypothetical protein